MRPFLGDDFLLETDAACRLYHDHAAALPIIDYHCHLPPDDIADDRQFDTLTAAWLEGDHYKWRAMRTNGVPERFCTGDATDWEKFERWAETVPYTVMNPLYHWTHMELRRPFGIDALLGPATARAVYDRAKALLATPSFSTRGLLHQMNVAVVCTTDDPADALESHRRLRADGFGVLVVPGFRPDRASAIQDPPAYQAYLSRLGDAAGVVINSPDALLDALQRRHDAFDALGCRLSDHGEERLYAVPYTATDIRQVFQAVMRGQTPGPDDVARFKAWLLYELALMDHAKGWVQQYHLGALRNNNTRMQKRLGPDSGFDAIGDFEMARPLARFLDRLDATDQLAPTILYNLNPAHNEVFAALAGTFSTGPQPGKIQFGTAWWFMDQQDGMERQMTALANMGLLSRFVGMVTDSRSFLSYPRHAYFRRLLCNMIGGQVERGLLPPEMDWLGRIVEGICYYNAKAYFGF